IGGPSMIRSAAKNQEYVGVVTSAAQYEGVLQALQTGTFDLAYRRKLANQAFARTAEYDTAIAAYFKQQEQQSSESTEVDLPETLTLTFQKQSVLRYGENPHQRAAFYVEPQ